MRVENTISFLFAALMCTSFIYIQDCRSHTVEICAEVSGSVVNFYAGTYHNNPSDGSTFGAVILSNGPQGNGRKEFTSVVIDDNETPSGVDLTNFDCARCSNYGASGINYWQFVQVSGLSNGIYDVTTSADGTTVEDPYCTEFGSVTIANLETESPTPGPSPNPTPCPSPYPSQYPTFMPTPGCGVSECPVACKDDPCNCDDVGMCKDGLCRSADGCSQCEDGYFKKDDNYPCTQCQEVFGDDCIHCTDFLGCQQCATGVRLYDPECGLYFCDDDGSCSNSTGNTPAPTRSPTEEASDDVDDGDDDDDSSSFSCVNGYFIVDLVDVTEYVYLLGKYSYNGEETADDRPIYESDSNDAIAYQNSDNVFVFESPDGMTYFTLPINNINDIAGENLYEVTPVEGEVNININVFDCDGNLITNNQTIYSCTKDCIDVSGMTVDETTDAGIKLNELFESDNINLGGNSAFNGRYCYNDSNGIYAREIEDDEMYMALLYLSSDSTSNGALVTFEYCVYGSCYYATYSEGYNSGDAFACDDTITAFFDSTSDSGRWDYSSDDFEINFDGVTLNDPTFEFDDCVGADFYCDLFLNDANNLKLKKYLYIISFIMAIRAAMFAC